MTLKDKVAEMHPYNVSPRFAGGVYGCHGYSVYSGYLNDTRITGSHECKHVCEACWNREFKEKEDAKENL